MKELIPREIMIPVKVGLWWKKNEIGKLLFSKKHRQERRQRKRRLRELGVETEIPMLNLGTRTSTNAFVGGGIFIQIFVYLVQLIPGEGAIEALLLQPESVAFAGVLFAALVARFSKTPAVPGKL